MERMRRAGTSSVFRKEYEKTEADSQGGLSRAALLAVVPTVSAECPCALNLAERSSSAHRDDYPILKRSGGVRAGATPSAIQDRTHSSATSYPTRRRVHGPKQERQPCRRGQF